MTAEPERTTDPADAVGEGLELWDDPIVAEVRVIREQLLAEAGGTLDGLVAMLRASEAVRGLDLVTLPPRSPDDSDAHAA